MSETISGEVCKITPGEEAGQEYECRFALRNIKGLFFVWDPETEGLDLLEDGAELRITHDGSKYKKVEKIEGPDKKLSEPPKEQEGKKSEKWVHPSQKYVDEKKESKIEKTMKKVETEDETAWRIARACAVKLLGEELTSDEIVIQLKEGTFYIQADEIATYIVQGQKPTKKKQ